MYVSIGYGMTFPDFLFSSWNSFPYLAIGWVWERLVGVNKYYYPTYMLMSQWCTIVAIIVVCVGRKRHTAFQNRWLSVHVLSNRKETHVPEHDKIVFTSSKSDQNLFMCEQRRIRLEKIQYFRCSWIIIYIQGMEVRFERLHHSANFGFG